MGHSLRVLSASSRLPVLIVGGGLGGFTAALSLHRAGIRNNIIMKEANFIQHPRSGVFLGSSAVRILDRLGLGSQFRTLGTPLHHILVEDLSGREIISFRLDTVGAEIWTLPRANLQQLLLESIPPDTVHFDSKFRALRCTENGVHVKVQKRIRATSSVASPDPIILQTRFIIGADGHNSAVRTFMSRPAMTIPSGTIVWRAVVQNRNMEDFPLHAGKEIWGPSRRLGFARMNPEEVVWWAVITDSPEPILRPFTPRLLRAFEEFPAVATDLISSVESDRDIYRTDMKRVWPEQFPWVDHSSCRIALVGDAGRPGHFGNFHSGHTFAVEDGYFLAHHLAEQNEKGMLKAGPKLHGYEESREEQMAATKKYSYGFNRLSLWQSSVGRYFARKFLQFSLEHSLWNGKASTIPITGTNK